MPDRHSDRERWESIFLIILLATRPILFIGAVILLIYAFAAMAGYPVAGWISAGLSIYLFSLVFSDQSVRRLASFGAWIATRWRT